MSSRIPRRGFFQVFQLGFSSNFGEDLVAEHADNGLAGPDEEFKSDPLYALDLKEHLKQLFISGLTNNTGSLQQYVSLLEPIDQKSLSPETLQAM